MPGRVAATEAPNQRSTTAKEALVKGIDNEAASTKLARRHLATREVLDEEVPELSAEPGRLGGGESSQHRDGQCANVGLHQLLFHLAELAVGSLHENMLLVTLDRAGGSPADSLLDLGQREAILEAV